jgi:riboflavin kinase / FMN adenylyltransferase
MDVLGSVDSLPARLRFVLCIGVFDGLHRGHARMLGACVGAAKARRAQAVVVTFEPHPDEVLQDRVSPRLLDPSEKLARLERMGVDVAVVQRFDRAFAAQSAEEFLDRVARDREMAGVVMTPETAFGRDRAGTLLAVEALARRHGFACLQVPELRVGGERISSSRLRDELIRGRLSEVRRLLGRDYAVIGEVVHGDSRGRDLGFPTANLRFDRPVALPADGIYAVRVTWGGADPLTPVRRADGVAALGIRPTFGGGDRTLEVHLFDVDEGLYGERLRVAFVRRQRGEKRFATVAALVAQMERDAARARRILDVPATA